MKTLIMLRHGKSDWSGRQLPDKDRPLNARGRRAAPLMGAWLADEGFEPDTALVSTSLRTRQTWARLAPLLTHPPEPQFCDELYLATDDALLSAARRAGKGRRLIMIGHNPGMEIAVQKFAQTDSTLRMPTCAAAAIEFDVESWADIGFELGSLAAFETPKSLV